MEDLICNEPPSICIFAVVVEDIISRGMTTSGKLPNIIPKGYQTWINIAYEKDLKTKNGIVCPEGNRWEANIPSGYFKEITKEEFYREIIDNFYAI